MRYNTAKLVAIVILFIIYAVLAAVLHSVTHGHGVVLGLLVFGIWVSGYTLGRVVSNL